MRMTRTFAVLSLAGALAAAGTHANAAGLTPVPNAQPKVVGNSAPNVLSPELAEKIVAQGSNPLENGTVDFPFYGYNGDGTMLPAPGDVQSATHNVEATKTEPDKNTYLVLPGLGGPDSHYDYGKRFLFQGHELGKGFITRINLDADYAHRVTLLASTDIHGNPLPVFDGSTWYPFSLRLLFSAENSTTGGVWQATPSHASVVERLTGAFGHASYEGMQADPHGNIWVVEDAGGPFGTANPHARQPNSFLFRFIPKDKTDLTKGGKLQALQVISMAHAGPIVFHTGQADADITSQDQKDLHKYGNVFDINWVTIHDTGVDGVADFDANDLAKKAGATPFKRPENGQFRPGSGFREFFFDTTGDTSAATEAGAFGGFGAIFKLSQSSSSADHGKLTLFFLGDIDHTGLDNCAFWSDHEIVFVEDRGDGLHKDHNAFDSAFLFDTRVNYGNPANHPVRILALGRDASATIDSGLSGSKGFQNEGDNEITGIHISDGDPGVFGLLGAKIPNPFHDGWRVFYTQQHGDNQTWEIIPAKQSRHHGHDDDDDDDDRR